MPRRTCVNVGNGVSQQQPADPAIGGLANLFVVGRAVETDKLASRSLGIAQVVQPSDNLELPFGSTSPSSKSALAALTISSSASSSLIRCRAVPADRLRNS